MRTSTFSLLAAVGLAAAAPTARQAPNYPPASSSNAFRLVVNVTDPTTDFTPSINDYVLTSYHVGAGEAYAVLQPNLTFTSGRILYENGTAYDVRFGAASVISDGGTPPFPEGLYVQNETEFDYKYTTQHNAMFLPGGGTKGVGLAQFPNPIPYLANPGSGSFAACNNTLPYGPAFSLVYAYATFTDADGNYDYQKNIPEGCAEITLLPECATINDLPAGSYSSHEFASTQRCYEDVSAIDWTVYSA